MENESEIIKELERVGLQKVIFYIYYLKQINLQSKIRILTLLEENRKIRKEYEKEMIDLTNCLNTKGNFL